jgi:hypothetical protein
MADVFVPAVRRGNARGCALRQMIFKHALDGDKNQN